MEHPGNPARVIFEWYLHICVCFPSTLGATSIPTDRALIWTFPSCVRRSEDLIEIHNFLQSLALVDVALLILLSSAP